MAKSHTAPPFPPEVKEDVDVVFDIIGDLNRIISICANTQDLVSMQTAVNLGKVFARFSAVWESKIFNSFDVRRTADAYGYLLAFCDPFLSPADLESGLGGGAFMAGIPRPQAFSFKSEASVAYDQAFSVVGASVQSQFLPEFAPQIENLIRGVILLCSIPVWTLYRALHGLATFTSAQSILRASLRAADRMSNDALATIGQPQVSTSVVVLMPQTAMASLAAITNILSVMITRKVAELDTFSQQVLALPARQSVVDGQLQMAMKAGEFWRTGATIDEVEVDFSTMPSQSAGARVFDYKGSVFLAHDADPETQSRAFFDLELPHRRLVNCARLVAQAGFHLIVNAASNPHGGRHPPHLTHASGAEFDLDWTFTASTAPYGPSKEQSYRDADVVRNLARMTAVQGSHFLDLKTGSFLDLVPADPRSDTPATQVGIEKLSTLVVLQAVALSGLPHCLYVDFQNMQWASTCLELGLGDKRFGWGNALFHPLVEGKDHWNHLHAESVGTFDGILSGVGVDQRARRATLTALFRWSLKRDTSKEFLDSLFTSPRTTPGLTPQQVAEQVVRVQKVKTDWLDRAAKGTPALLPLWLSTEDASKLSGF